MATSKTRWVIYGALTLAINGTAEAKPPAFSVVAGDGAMVAGSFTAGEQGAIFAGPGGSRLELAPGTRLRIFMVPQQLQLQPGPHTTTHTVVLTSGRVEVQVPEQSEHKKAILVSFPRKLMAIATGGTLVAVASPSMSAVATTSGQVLASWGSAFAPLEAGRLRRMMRGTEIEGDVPKAPNWEPGRRVWIAVDGTESIDDLRWQPVPEAARYQIELRRNGEELPFSVQNSATPHMEGTFVGLGPGIYQANVRAFDAHGIAGRASEPVRLHVLGVNLPGGSLTTKDGALVLAPGQQARFSHADGLLMSYLGATRYYPANSSVGLYRNERTVVHFRAPGTDQFASVRMEPRSLRADVSIGPKTAVWPRDEVVIRVRLHNEDGTPVPQDVEAKPEVSLGIDRIDLKWRREGDELVANVPPARTAGPWVVRVDVKDQFGIPLGRDFLEIVGQRPAPRAPNAEHADRSAKKPRG